MSVAILEAIEQWERLPPMPRNTDELDRLCAASDAIRDYLGTVDNHVSTYKEMVLAVLRREQAANPKKLAKAYRLAQSLCNLLKRQAADGKPANEALPAAMQYVTLDQAAATVNRSKRTLEKRANRKKNPLPDPAVQGAGGKPSEWIWTDLRPWLEQEYGKRLPERFPARRN
jgi:hypothetical protein